MKSPTARSLAGTAILRLIALALGFITNIVLARALGVKEYGIFSYVLAWIGLLSAVGIFGIDRLLVREVAAYIGKSDWGRLRGLLGWGHLTPLLISIGITGVAVIAGRYATGGLDSELDR
jgi:O-antigen/teichoic acid export membrane protein